jgi:hypothetical protein
MIFEEITINKKESKTAPKGAVFFAFRWWSVLGLNQ